MKKGDIPPKPTPDHDHIAHLDEHDDIILDVRYGMLSAEIRAGFETHKKVHIQMAKEQMAMAQNQLAAAAQGPGGASAPTRPGPATAEEIPEE